MATLAWLEESVTRRAEAVGVDLDEACRVIRRPDFGRDFVNLRVDPYV
jgi:hypothetical protein